MPKIISHLDKRALSLVSQLLVLLCCLRFLWVGFRVIANALPQKSNRILRDPLMVLDCLVQEGLILSVEGNNCHHILSKRPGFIAADIVRTSHDFAGSQIFHEVLFVLHLIY